MTPPRPRATVPSLLTRAAACGIALLALAATVGQPTTSPATAPAAPAGAPSAAGPATGPASAPAPATHAAPAPVASTAPAGEALPAAARIPSTGPAQSSAPPQNNPRGQRVSYNDRYGIIAERNIFLRDRRAAAAAARGGAGGGATSQPTQGRPTGERALVLTGVAVELDGLRAYLEDLERGTVVKVSVGDALARGRVSAIEIDAMQYQNPAGQLTWITVGDDLTGRPSPAMSSDSGGGLALAATASTMPSGIDGLNPNDPNLTIEQKMKLRRAAEMQKK
ncbi:MAG TPA: hypothetical protein VER17_10180 [Tepidisphaeraceae bacterium]|nr:hypothetical protein [Tepidisphaeraceae bacterium]